MEKEKDVSLKENLTKAGYTYRITESQNVRVWKGPLGII